MGDVQDNDGARVFFDPAANAPVSSAAGRMLLGILVLQRIADAVRILQQRAGEELGVAFLLPAGHTGVVTADQLEMISTDPGVMHGQAVIAGTRVPVSVILDCLAAAMTAEEITAEYPAITVADVRAAAAYGAALAREELLPLPHSR